MLGLFWSLALPVMLMLVYLVVFSGLLASPTTEVDHYWLFLLCGLAPWVFFATSLQSSARSLLENASLIRKMRFPRQLVPLSIVATQLVAFAVMTAVVVALAMIVQPDSRTTAWLAIPIACVCTWHWDAFAARANPVAEQAARKRADDQRTQPRPPVPRAQKQPLSGGGVGRMRPTDAAAATRLRPNHAEPVANPHFPMRVSSHLCAAVFPAQREFSRPFVSFLRSGGGGNAPPSCAGPKPLPLSILTTLSKAPFLYLGVTPPLEANGMQRWWKRCIENAGISACAPHGAQRSQTSCASQREPEAHAAAGPTQGHLDHGEHLRPPGRHGP